jgi:hypothetical protein
MSTGVWSEKDILTFLVRFSKKQGLPFDQFPEQIDLTGYWQNIYKEMRRKTETDNHERFAGFGIKNNTIKSTPVIKGEKEQVYPSTQKPYLQKLYDDGVIISGSIHSHGRSLLGSLCTLIGVSRLYKGFAPEELTYLINPHFGLSLYGLVDRQEDVMIFKSYETNSIPMDPKNLKSFYWYDKVLSEFKIESVCQNVAKYYKLPLYIGKPNGILKRVV